jgi:AraC-like DNA-binding protein
MASLACELAMSRSAFAARFSQLADEPRHGVPHPLAHAAAQQALQTEGATAAELASRLGYHSEAAFARAFKRAIGLHRAPSNAAAIRGQPPQSRLPRPGVDARMVFVQDNPRVEDRSARWRVIEHTNVRPGSSSARRGTSRSQNPYTKSVHAERRSEPAGLPPHASTL